MNRNKTREEHRRDRAVYSARAAALCFLALLAVLLLKVLGVVG